MAAVASDITVTFDENYKVRVLDAERFKQTEALETECNEFVKRIRTFNGTVRSLVEVLSKQASAIETAKLRAIGMRNAVDAEEENQVRQKAELQALINEKKAQWERLNQQYESLVKVEAQQKILIEKLSNNEA